MEKLLEEIKLPTFVSGILVRETENYKVVMDYKPGMENSVIGQRFFIEPKSAAAEKMLELAAVAHNLGRLNFNLRLVRTDKEVVARMCLRAGFLLENLPALLLGVTEIPEIGEDTTPSPDRMEKCLKLNPHAYSYNS